MKFTCSLVYLQSLPSRGGDKFTFSHAAPSPAPSPHGEGRCFPRHLATRSLVHLFTRLPAHLLTFSFFLFLSIAPAFSQQGWNYLHPGLSIQNRHGAICPVSRDTVFVVADQGKFLVTDDGGATWLERSTGAAVSFFDLSFITNSLGYAVGQGGTIVKTGDLGACWGTLESGTHADLFSVCTRSETDVWAVGDSGVILHATDYGLTWVKLPQVTTKRLNSIAFKGNTGLIAGNDGTLLISTDNGSSWSAGNPGTTDDLFSLVMTPQYAYALAGLALPDNGNGYQFGAWNILRTSDFSNWDSFDCEPGMSPISKISFPCDCTGYGIASGLVTDGYGFLYLSKTTDSGETWTNTFESWDPPYGLSVSYGDIRFINDTVGYALCGNNILKTLDGGKLTGIKEINPTHRFTIYPNPATSNAIQIRLDMSDQSDQSDRLDRLDRSDMSHLSHLSNLSYSSNPSNLSHPSHLSLQFSDLNGRVVLVVPVVSEQQSIDISGLAKGVYFVNLMRGERVVGVERFVKE